MEKGSFSFLFLVLFPRKTTNKYRISDLTDLYSVSGRLFHILVSGSPDARLGQASQHFNSSTTWREMDKSVLNFYFFKNIFCMYFSCLSTISAIGTSISPYSVSVGLISV